MTFIASVIAKKGVAVIADSLVTSVRPIIEIGDFIDYIKVKQAQAGNLQAEFTEIIKLFREKTSHTKDYEEKLFEYDNYTAITTAGYASINDKRIAEIVAELRENNLHRKNIKSYTGKNIEKKVNDFCAHLTREIKEHLKKNDEIGTTSFIFTHFNSVTHKSIIYKIDVERATKERLEDENHQFVSYELQGDIFKVVCDGQNRISERILFGDRNTIGAIVPKIIGAVLENFGIDESAITKEKYTKIVDDSELINSDFLDDMKIFQLTELSLQQAVDLACLLMRIERDFQKYTRNIPTVGGVIKLAVIDEKGFRFIHGYDIIKPDII